MTYLLDSVILIDHFNGIKHATTFIAEHSSACSLSVITRAEVLAGFDEDREPLARQLLNTFVTLPVTADIADLAARLRRCERWKLPDAIQAAITKHHGLTLVTRNTRDFQPGGDIEVMIPYQV